jgi:hypothetical protein
MAAEVKDLRDSKGRFAPGCCPNPGGRPKAEHRITDLAREYTIEAIETLAEIMQDEEQPANARLAAAVALLDRGWGKPPIQTFNVTTNVSMRELEARLLENKAEVDGKIAEARAIESAGLARFVEFP